MRLNCWTVADANDYMELAFKSWEFRGDMRRQLDLRWLVRHGVSGPVG
jgi:hypothetical protein